MAITTLGQILVNEKLPDDLKDYNRVLDKKNVHKLMSDVGNKYQHLYPDIAKNLKDIGDEFATNLGSSFTLDDFKPVDMSHVYKKYNKDYHDARQIKNEVLKDNKFKEINKKLEDEVNGLVKHDIATDNNLINKWVLSGAKGKPENIRQMRYSVGNQVNVKNQIFPHYAFGSLSEGLSPSSFYIGALGARKGVVGSFISVRDPGAFAKELFTLTNDMITTIHDCGTLDGEVYDIHSPDILDRCLAENVSTFKRNDIVTSHVQDALIRNSSVSNIHRVKVRTPLHCQSKEGVCSMCIGLLETGKLSHIGDTIGLRSAQSLTEPLTQMALSSKHSGGVVGKKTAFETVKQLMHVPEEFPGGAVLSMKHGTIDKITKSPDGGHHVTIDKTEHYVLPTQTILHKVGDSITKGDAITDGLINPAKIVELKGMNAGRRYLADKLREVYADNGANGHAKIFETVARSAINLGKVKNPGDHNDFSEGDIIRWNQHQHLTQQSPVLKPVSEVTGFRMNSTQTIGNKVFNGGHLISYEDANHFQKHGIKDLQVYKNPLQLEPYMLGTERAALHKGDWLSNMGYRFVKGQLLDNMAVLKSTDLHSHDPIPSYVSGNFSYNEGGKF